MLSKKREEELSELAEYVANAYCPNDIVSPSFIAEQCGITYCSGDYGDAFDGLIEQEARKFHIYINIHKGGFIDSHRSRFTFAHELGHYFIDEHRCALLNGKTPSHSSVTDFSSKNPVEVEADFFASSLLLPESRIKQDCFKKKFTFQLIESLSKKYNTSLTATLLKYSSIGNHPIMIVCSVNNKIKWFRYSHDFPYKWLKLPKGVVPKYTLAGAYFKDKTKFDDTLPVAANEWFDYVKDKDIDRPFYEKCIYADNHNFVLSIIWED
jgi:hypothetical protein